MNLLLSSLQVVVVGGTNGIGLGIVTGFLEENAIVHVISRNPNKDLANNLQTKYPGKVFFYLCDATDEMALSAIRLNILGNADQKIDILISNVGNGKGTQLPAPEKEEWDRSWDINFSSALHCARIFSQDIAQTKGALLFISSIAGMEFVGAPTVYSTAKSSLIAFSKSLSHRLAPVRVNVVCPGNIWVENGTWDQKMKADSEAVQNMLVQKVPLKRLGLATEVADLVLFLSSPKAAFITGACFVIDGGQTISF